MGLPVFKTPSNWRLFLILLAGCVLGVGFGCLYFGHGLESAMLSHFSADIVLHVLFAIWS